MLAALRDVLAIIENDVRSVGRLYVLWIDPWLYYSRSSNETNIVAVEFLEPGLELQEGEMWDAGKMPTSQFLFHYGQKTALSCLTKHAQPFSRWMAVNIMNISFWCLCGLCMCALPSGFFALTNTEVLSHLSVSHTQTH